jgi:hypothetical protein
MDAMTKDDIRAAVDKALGGDWEGAHKIVQADENDPTACWVHAVLHKIEGDAANSRYWYARADRSYEAYADATAELKLIVAGLAV